MPEKPEIYYWFRGWCQLTLCVSFLLICLVVPGCVYSHLETRAFLEAGYEQGSLPGIDGTRWVKRGAP